MRIIQRSVWISYEFSFPRLEFQTKMFLTSYKFPGQDPSKKNHQILSLNVSQDIEWNTWNLLNHIKAL